MAKEIFVNIPIITIASAEFLSSLCQTLQLAFNLQTFQNNNYLATNSV
jgi:hypothetical protein